MESVQIQKSIRVIMPAKKAREAKPYDAAETSAIFARFEQSMEYFGRVHERMYPLEAISYPQLFNDMQFLVDQTRYMLAEMEKIKELRTRVEELKYLVQKYKALAANK